MMPAEPSIVPIFIMGSMSTTTSISSAVSTGADEPPGITAFSFRSPRMHSQVEAEARAQDVFPQVTLVVGLFDGIVEKLRFPGVLAPDVDVSGGGADRVPTDDHALDEQVRGVPHDIAVLESPWLGFV